MGSSGSDESSSRMLASVLAACMCYGKAHTHRQPLLLLLPSPCAADDQLIRRAAATASQQQRRHQRHLHHFLSRHFLTPPSHHLIAFTHSHTYPTSHPAAVNGQLKEETHKRRHRSKCVTYLSSPVCINSRPLSVNKAESCSEASRIVGRHCLALLFFSLSLGHGPVACRMAGRR